MTGAAVFVTGASGTVGRAVADQLTRRGVPVIAAIRRRADIDRIPAAATPRVFEFGSTAAELAQALDGCDRLFLMRPPAIDDVRRYLFPLIDASGEAGVRQIVFLSLQGVQANRKTPHHAVEAYLKKSGSPYTFLRPNFLMQNLSTTYADSVREHDEIFVPAGRSHTAFIDARDTRCSAHGSRGRGCSRPPDRYAGGRRPDPPPPARRPDGDGPPTIRRHTADPRARHRSRPRPALA